MAHIRSWAGAELGSLSAAWTARDAFNARYVAVRLKNTVSKVSGCLEITLPPLLRLPTKDSQAGGCVSRYYGASRDIKWLR